MSRAVERRTVGTQSVLVAGPASAPSVVLLHGIGSSAASFAAQLDVLGGRRRVLAPDAPGYAHSADSERPLGLDGYADGVVALLDAEGIERTAIVGVSWGGVIATRLALRHPRRVSALVLADTSRGSGIRRRRAETMLRRPEELARDGAAVFASRRAPRLLSSSASAEVVDAVSAAMASSIRLPGYARAAASMAATDHSGDLDRIAVPTLVVVGAEDSICPPDEARAITAGIPGARLEVITGAGHLANQERADEFNRLVERFLDELHGDALTTAVADARPIADNH